jgi:twitching motility protein PilJ
MSLKDFFSKNKQKNNSKLDQNINEETTFHNDDFAKSEQTQDYDLNTLNTLNETDKNHLSLRTDVDLTVEDGFFDKFNTVNDFEERFEELSDNKKDVNLEGLSFNVEEAKADEKTLMALYEEEKITNGNSNSIAVKLESSRESDDEEYSAEDLEKIRKMQEELDAMSKDGLLENDFQEQVVAQEFNLEEEVKNEDVSDNFNTGSALEQEEMLEQSSENKIFDVNSNLSPRSNISEDGFERHTVDSQNSLDRPTLSVDRSTASDLDRPSISDFNDMDFNPSGKKVKSKSKGKNKESKSNKNRSIFGTISTKSQYVLFFSTLVVSASGIGFSLYSNNKANVLENQAATITSDMWGATQKIGALYSNPVVQVSSELEGFSQTFGELSQNRRKLSDAVIPLKNDRINETVLRLEEDFKKLEKNTSFLRTQDTVLRDVAEKVKHKEFYTNISSLISLVEKMGVIYVQLGVSQSELSQIYTLKSSLELIRTSTDNMLMADNLNKESIDTLNNAKSSFKTNLSELYNGSDVKNIKKLNSAAIPAYNALAKNWMDLSSNLDKVFKNSEVLTTAKTSVQENKEVTLKINEELKKLLSMYDNSLNNGSQLFNYMLIASLLLLLISLIGLAYVYNTEKEKLSKEFRNESDNNKKAIFKLLNEMIPLQDGDLTQKTSVEEGITSNIADSINATIDSLASVVTRIKNTSLVMREKTAQMNNISQDMLVSSEKQADSIVETGESVIKIAQAINEISEKTKLSLITAQKSAQSSTVGEQQVRESIESMTAINKNMEETVHLMKKVSDSSKKISEVIELLADITEETNILALNATVQAAKAGEAGKGFKIVADSIQELADNAAEATRRVGALIATVQTDIQSVGVSIEKTTQEVHRGVERSENAGKSLAEISEISNQLADIVKTISKDANTNAEAARKISNNMKLILQITEETTESTKQTTNSIQEIAKMSDELGESVQSFVVR